MVVRIKRRRLSMKYLIFILLPSEHVHGRSSGAAARYLLEATPKV
jgi:hypothetical protein